MTDTLATQLLRASQTGQLDSQAAPALLSLLEQLHRSLSTGQPNAALTSLDSILAPLAAHRQAHEALTRSFAALTQALTSGAFSQLPSDPAGLAALGEELQALIDAAEDTSARIDAYLRLAHS